MEAHARQQFEERFHWPIERMDEMESEDLTMDREGYLGGWFEGFIAFHEEHGREL